MNKESPKKKDVRLIIEQMLTVETEQNLRSCLKKLN